MREFHRRKKGEIILTGIIYDNKEECPYSVKRWAEDEIVIGDWVIADDGFVLQCLNIKEYVNKKKYRIKLFKFVIGTFYQLARPSKTYYQSFYGQFTRPNLYRIGTTATSGQGRKKIFAKLFLSGIPLRKATFEAFGTNNISYGLTMLNDKTVKLEFKNELESFMSKLKDNFTEDRLIDELEELLSKSRKGSMAHRQNLELILQLTGYMDNPNPKKKNVEEADYKEMVPPQLPS